MTETHASNLRQCEDIGHFIDFKGKKILEIGCGNGDLLKMIARNHGPAHIVGVDPGLSTWWQVGENEGPNWSVRHGDAEDLRFDDDSFDAVISISTFEHIHDVGKALSEIRRVLKPCGRLYVNFSPIWTSAAGHHFVIASDWDPDHLRLVPPWGHLYMDEGEMRTRLSSQTGDAELAERILDFIYHSEIINRRSRSELTECIMFSGMIVRYFKEFVNFSRFRGIKDYPDKSSELTPEILERIRATKYDPGDLGVLGIRACLEKYRDL